MITQNNRKFKDENPTNNEDWCAVSLAGEKSGAKPSTDHRHVFGHRRPPCAALERREHDEEEF